MVALHRLFVLTSSHGRHLWLRPVANQGLRLPVYKEVTAAYRVALDPLFDALLGMTKVVEMTGSESCLTQLSGLPLLYAHDERRYSAFLSYSMTIDHFGMSHCCASTALPVVGL